MKANLFSESAPRSAELVAVTMGRAYLVACQRAFHTAVFVFVTTVLSGFAGVLYELQRHHDHDTEAFAWALMLGLIVVAALTSMGLRRGRLRGLESIRQLVRDGTAHHATITKWRPHAYGSFVEVTFTSGKARFDLPRVKLTGSEDVTVLAGDGPKIAAQIGEHGVFLGERA